MASVEEVCELLRLAVKYRLDGAAFAMTFPLVQLAADYNGVGPEWFPAWARHVLDNICATLLPAVLIHDVRYSHSDGSVEQFVAANDELRTNGYRLADDAYAWWHPMRYVTRHRARVLYRLCRDFGWRAYEAAYIKNQEHNN